MLPVFLLVASLVSVEGWRQGTCLGYDVLCTTADYQLRRYNESVWVGMHTSEFCVTNKETIALRLYFGWQNSKGMEFQWTGQALVSLSGSSVLAVFLMLPEELWDNPPTPTYPSVFLTRLPAMDVFARDARWFDMTDGSDFDRTLTEQNVPVNKSIFFVSYCTRKNIAFDHLFQEKEIWFVATGGFDCPAP